MNFSEKESEFSKVFLKSKSMGFNQTSYKWLSVEFVQDQKKKNPTTILLQNANFDFERLKKKDSLFSLLVKTLEVNLEIFLCHFFSSIRSLTA